VISRAAADCDAPRRAAKIRITRTIGRIIRVWILSWDELARGAIVLFRGTLKFFGLRAA